ncbi:MAG: 2-oxoglutarate dehydrogenase E1 component [Planctomycetota bacterium]|nr:MAG: 2-oxoglutarate dehydrogenase E1 component [Planctomycetota bacterium]
MISPSAHFAHAGNSAIMDELFEQWEQDPSSVSPEWQAFFAGLRMGMERYDEEDESETSDQHPATLRLGSGGPGTGVGTDDKPGRRRQQRVDSLIYAYRDIGHTVCELDPLGRDRDKHNPLLDIDRFDIQERDLNREFACASIAGMGDRAPLHTIIDTLRDTYCGTVGVEYLHIQDPAVREWVKEQIEPTRNRPQLGREDRSRILYKLCQAEQLETFIHTKYLGQKRFSLEGGESLIPGLDAIVEHGATIGVKEFVFGMAHRGRLNVLNNILNKSHEEIFAEFEGTLNLADEEGDGDVKYHLGFSSHHTTTKGHSVHMTLTANPSHLEAVNPVVEGRVRGKQRQQDDIAERKKVVPVLIHGDAAFAGQGLVMETIQMSKLEGYATGGTVHIVLNNQIGFTTLPADARSTRYCTDIAKMFDAPVFHVNGDDVEAVVHVCRMAMEYRQRFGGDVFIDLVCYRRFGHNETDEPNYTQPTMYALIANHPRPSVIYTEKLIREETLDQAEIDGIARIMKNQMQDALDTVKGQEQKPSRVAFQGVWQGFDNRYRHDPVPTGVKEEALQKIGVALSTWPDGFAIHPKIRRLAEERGRAIREGDLIDWALGELLAFGSLLLEGTPIRLSGQDSRRGTFSQRHSYWYDTNTRERYKPLNHIADVQENYCVYNSFLSEAAVLGFDYGYSLSEPNMLIIWEAQFGDFVNGAQVIIDQFLTSSESKWDRVSGLVMMLPHGQEGMGPEHSSARLERFLTACAEDNIQVAHCTTAAQHFHILRRQMKRAFRKPLILMTPKSHLRSQAASSPLSDFTSGRFQEVLDDPQVTKDQCQRLILCSGKVAHDLFAKRKELDRNDSAIIRIEQLYPFPGEQLKTILAQYPQVNQVVWCQEEPQNNGPWSFIAPRLENLGLEVSYVGRRPAASPAPGRASRFKTTQEQLVNEALGVS